MKDAGLAGDEQALPGTAQLFRVGYRARCLMVTLLNRMCQPDCRFPSGRGMDASISNGDED